MAKDEFDWGDKESVVVKSQDAIAVYPNPDGDIVIRRQQSWQEARMFGSWFHEGRCAVSSRL